MTDDLATNIKYLRRACRLCPHSSCGYKVGCVAVTTSNKVIQSYNETLPGEVHCQSGECVREKMGYIGGQRIEIVCSLHAEASVVAKAAKAGVSLKAAKVFVTTFPCYICSKLLVKTGIGRLYYMSKYGGNEGQVFFQAAKIPVEQILETTVWGKS